MPYLLLLILLALVGGPWLVVFALTLTGVWFAIMWTIIGFCLIALLIGVIFAVLLVAVWSEKRWGKKKESTGFGAPLSELFKRTHGIEPGVWKDGKTYLVEAHGRTFYFSSLEEARAARDGGIEGYAAAVPIKLRSGMPQ